MRINKIEILAKRTHRRHITCQWCVFFIFGRGVKGNYEYALEIF